MGKVFPLFDFILTAEQFITSEISWQVMGRVNFVYWASVHFLWVHDFFILHRSVTEIFLGLVIVIV